MSKQEEKPDLTKATIERLAREHPEWANGIAKLSPEYQRMQSRVSQAETEAKMSVEEGAVHANINWTYNRYFEARHKYAENFSTLLVGTIDEMYEISGRIKNLHRMVHPAWKIPAWLVLTVVFGGIFSIALLAYPPYAIGVGGFLAGKSDNIPNIYPVLVFMVCIIAIMYLMVGRKRKKE